MKYESLGLAAKRGIWENLLKKAVTKKGGACQDLGFLAKKYLNGRLFQFKNIVFTAYALASRKRDRVAMSHLDVAVAAGEDFDQTSKGQVKLNMLSYL